MTEYWMQKAFAGKKCSLHKMLKIDCEKKIPITLLEKIRKTEIGDTAHNPTQTGAKTIKVTKKLKMKSVAALNARRVSQKR